MRLVFVRQRTCRLGDRAPCPPSSERAGDAADQSTDWACGRSDPRADEHSGNTAGCFAEFVGHARVVVMR